MTLLTATRCTRTNDIVPYLNSVASSFLAVDVQVCERGVGWRMLDPPRTTVVCGVCARCGNDAAPRHSCSFSARIPAVHNDAGGQRCEVVDAFVYCSRCAIP